MTIVTTKQSMVNVMLGKTCKGIKDLGGNMGVVREGFLEPRVEQSLKLLEIMGKS